MPLPSQAEMLEVSTGGNRDNHVYCQLGSLTIWGFDSCLGTVCSEQHTSHLDWRNTENNSNEKNWGKSVTKKGIHLGTTSLKMNNYNTGSKEETRLEEIRFLIKIQLSKLLVRLEHYSCSSFFLTGSPSNVKFYFNVTLSVSSPQNI